uniref:Uncharacterized protein n=1 Tax=Setaria italica TaxID=4555 RepID=K3XP54_SETIT
MYVFVEKECNGQHGTQASIVEKDVWRCLVENIFRLIPKLMVSIGSVNLAKITPTYDFFM